MKGQAVRCFSIILCILAALPAPAEEPSYHPLGEWRPITSKYGYRNNPFFRDRDQNFHKGIDIDTEVGDSVYAWRSGTIIHTGYSKTSGNLINIRHSDGYLSKYHHLYKILVKKGDVVQGGQLIALAGKSGRVTGAHLHFSVLRNGKHLDPYPLLRQSQKVPHHLPAARVAVPVSKQVVIRSYPVEGRVFVDEKPLGQGPVTVQLSYGEHFVEIDTGGQFPRFIARLWVDENFDHLYVADLRSQR